MIKIKKISIVLLSTIVFLTSCGENKEKNGGNDDTSIKNNIIDSTNTVEPAKPIVNVFVENSGSMYGYISHGNDFDRSISSLLTAINVSQYSDSLNLHYINSRIFRQMVDIPTFINNTNVHNATTWGGVKTKTDICDLLDIVTSYVDNNSISIFVSDCIFSPGTIDAKKYLGTQKDCISNRLSEKLETHKFGFIVYRLLSQFQGDYFDCIDHPTKINDLRPYFIWIVGTKENIITFQQKIPSSKIEGQLKNAYIIFNNELNNSYAIQLNPKIGNFTRTNPTAISKARRDNEADKFMFSVGADYSSLLVEDDYLTNPNNYVISNPNYSIEIIKRKMGNHTHLIKITTTSNIISPTNLTIELKNKIPDWVYDSSDETCASINSEGMMKKTYGFKQIIQGIFNAYNYEDDILYKITISINQ